MAEFPILFTGKDVSYEPRSTGQLERAGQRFDERFIEAAKVKRQDKMRDEDFFFKAADVDPVALMSGQTAKLQEDSMNDYNEKWAGVYSKQGGTLTNQQKSHMFRDRKSLEAQQQSWLASQQMWERDYEMIKRDSNRASQLYKHDTFQKASEDYFNTGKYEGALQYTSINPHDYFDKKSKSWKGDGAYSSDIEIAPGKYTKVGQNASIEAAQDEVEREIMQGGPNGRLLQGVVEEFVALPDEVKDKFLPAFDGVADTRDEKNGIVQWAREEYAPRLRSSTEATREREPTTSTAAADRVYTYSDSKLIDKSGNEVLRFTKDAKGNIVGKGKGLKSIKMDLSPQSLMGKGGKSLSKSLGGEIVNDVVTVRPSGIGNPVTLITTSAITVKKKGEDIPSSMNYDDKGVEGPDADGNYTWEEKIPAGMELSAGLSNVESELATYLGGEAFQKAVDENFPDKVEPMTTEGAKGVWNKVKDFFTSPAPTKKPEAKEKDKEEEIDFDQFIR